MGPFELDRAGAVLNRLLALALAAFFIALAVRFHAPPRRRSRALHPSPAPARALARRRCASLPLAARAAGAGARAGRDGPPRRGVGARPRRRRTTTGSRTWPPGRTRRSRRSRTSTSTLSSSRRSSHFADQGTLHAGQPARAAAAALRADRRPPLDGAQVDPERQGLQAGGPDARSTCSRPTARSPPGGTAARRLRLRGRLPQGLSKNGGGTGEFILPSGRGADRLRPVASCPSSATTRRSGSRRTRTGTSRASTPTTSTWGAPRPPSAAARPSPRASRITGPAEYRYNSVGVLGADTVEGGAAHGGLEDRPQGAPLQRRRGKVGRGARGRGRPSTTTRSTPTTSTR